MLTYLDAKRFMWLVVVLAFCTSYAVGLFFVFFLFFKTSKYDHQLKDKQKHKKDVKVKDAFAVDFKEAENDKTTVIYLCHLKDYTISSKYME